MNAVSTVSSYRLAHSVRQTGASGKLTVPVQQAASLYAHYKYVQGVPSSDGGGMPLSRVRVLNSLIDNMVQLKGKKASVPDRHQTGMSTEAVDAMIENLKKELHTEVAKVTPSFATETTAFTGTVLNMTA